MPSSDCFCASFPAKVEDRHQHLVHGRSVFLQCFLHFQGCPEFQWFHFFQCAWWPLTQNQDFLLLPGLLHCSWGHCFHFSGYCWSLLSSCASFSSDEVSCISLGKRLHSSASIWVKFVGGIEILCGQESYKKMLWFCYLDFTSTLKSVKKYMLKHFMP